jgi:hypothetical protein
MKLVTAAAFGLGYVLGTKAGRERYEQIRVLAHSASKNFKASDCRQTASSPLDAVDPSCPRARLGSHPRLAVIRSGR